MHRIFALGKRVRPDYFIAKLTQAGFFGADPDATPELVRCAGQPQTGPAVRIDISILGNTMQIAGDGSPFAVKDKENRKSRQG